SGALLAARQDDAKPLGMELIRRLEPQTAVRARDQGGWAIRCGDAHGFQTMAVAFVVLRRSAGVGAGPTPRLASAAITVSKPLSERDSASAFLGPSFRRCLHGPPRR